MANEKHIPAHHVGSPPDEHTDCGERVFTAQRVTPFWPEVTCDACWAIRNAVADRAPAGIVHHVGTACPLKFTGGTALHVSQAWTEVTCDECWDVLFAGVRASLAEKHRVARLSAMRAEVRGTWEHAAREIAAWSTVLGDALDLEARLTALMRRARAQGVEVVPEAGSDTSELQKRSQVVTPLLAKYEDVTFVVETSKPALSKFRIRCTCDYGPEDAHFTDCPMWQAPVTSKPMPY